MASQQAHEAHLHVFWLQQPQSLLLLGWDWGANDGEEAEEEEEEDEEGRGQRKWKGPPLPKAGKRQAPEARLARALRWG
ncbi:hypothetical protein O9K51_01625 [Purpureocillium lavendulum]|uniref:Uncharacterized protein n=1 Tax=Purpureocillium lavendulum TaxID=1247861 RepID=A0AB34G7X8_9HYPO|nr:hypothetical protein O9K51_01625 [Purpureocillium lavendulum]